MMFSFLFQLEIIDISLLYYRHALGKEARAVGLNVFDLHICGDPGL